MWDFTAATRLVEAVRLNGGPDLQKFHKPNDPQDLQAWESWREAMNDLATSISWVFTKRDAWRDLTDDGVANRRANELAEIRGQLARAKKRLDRDLILSERLNRAMPLEMPDIRKFLAALLDVAESVGTEFGDAALLSGPNSVGQTAQGTVIRSLAEAYRTYFCSDPSDGMKRTFKAYSGPFVSFVRTAFEIEGMLMNENALTVALERHFLH